MIRPNHSAERAVERRKIAVYTDKQRHDKNNLEAAQIIAADPKKYPVDGALAIWARMVRLAGENHHAEAA